MRPLALLFITIILFVSLSASEQPRGSSLAQILSTQQITRASKMIFSGVVLQVKRSQNATGSTQITFRVENAIRGVRRGQIIRVSEWSGLWNSGERYARGEHVLLFLYPKSKLGLTSPVGGNSGRYAVDAAGRVLVPSSQNGPHSFPLKTVKADIQRAAQE
jgi:hypothetical protein